MIKRSVFILLLVLVSVFALTAAGLGIAWGVTSRAARAESREYRNTIESIFQQNYYELTHNISNLATALNKLIVSNSDTMQKRLLDDVTEYSASTSANLASVLAENPNAEKVVRYVNQVGDYSKALKNRLNSGDSMTQEDEDTIESIYDTIKQIEIALDEIRDEVEMNGYVFLDNFGTDNDVFFGMLNNLESMSVDYPTLIYDGPFSEALETRTPKALSGNVLSEEQGKEKVMEYLVGHDVNSVEFIGESNNHFDALMYRANTEMGDIFIDISKKGGTIMDFCLAHVVETPNYSEEECVQAAEEYIEQIGFENMKSVWVSNYNSIIYVNFAYEQEGVIIYPDLIKVKISAENKAVVGVEALGYIYNHTQRTIESPAISESEARGAISRKIQIESVRLAIVPIDGGKEKLTYEIYGENGEYKYFFYIDASTGKEINIMRVIDSDKGELLV